MKVKAVRNHVLDHALERVFESASNRFTRRQHCLVEIECDDGTVGWGEEPVLPEQLGAYRAVRAGQPIPIAGGET